MDLKYSFGYLICDISTRSREGLSLDLEGLRKHFNSLFGDDGDPERHVVIALLGEVKGEHNEFKFVDG